MNALKALSVKTAVEMMLVHSVVRDKETKKKVLEAFQEAEDTWRDSLLTMVGEKDYSIIMHSLEEEIPGVAK